MPETNGTQITMAADLVEPNGKTNRENNAAVPHKHELGAVVEVDVEISQLGFDKSAGTEIALRGTCRLIVVGHIRDCDMTPLYILSDLPVRYPCEAPTFSQEKLVYEYVATLVESGYGEESLRSTGSQVPLTTVAEWLEEAED